jgi:hypothetical protein
VFVGRTEMALGCVTSIVKGNRSVEEGIFPSKKVGDVISMLVRVGMSLFDVGANSDAGDWTLFDPLE